VPYGELALPRTFASEPDASHRAGTGRRRIEPTRWVVSRLECRRAEVGVIMATRSRRRAEERVFSCPSRTQIEAPAILFFHRDAVTRENTLNRTTIRQYEVTIGGIYRTREPFERLLRPYSGSVA
jgi:hypothetical protein